MKETTDSKGRAALEDGRRSHQPQTISDRRSDERAKQLLNELECGRGRQNKNKPSPSLIGSLYLSLCSIAGSRTTRSSRLTSGYFHTF